MAYRIVRTKSFASAQRAIDLWGVLVKDDPNSGLVKEGKKWVADLEPLTKKK